MMGEFVPAEKQLLKMQPCKCVVDLRNRLWHAIVVGVFCLESKLLPLPRRGRNYFICTAAQSPVRADPPQYRVSVLDQAQTKVNVGRVSFHERWLRRAKRHFDDFVVEVRRTHCKLRLLECIQRIMMPGSLPECGKCHRMTLKCGLVRLPRSIYMLKKLGPEQANDWLAGLESGRPAQNFASVVAGHPHRSDLASLFAHEQVGSQAYICASVRHIHGPLRVGRKTRQKFLPH